ncbi:glycosyltransferase family 4 protein [Hominifimenecus sp. rT4P-3]|uniref:glycosyltransferase family 4 protein n=1 Tax=Hominifimenecus sp. rT4P-3 TaxID=3242979 RepID=UPI003DA67E34
MKIAFESQLLMEAEKTGIGWVADGILRELKSLDTKDQLQLNYFKLRNHSAGRPPGIEEYVNLGFQDVCARFSFSLYKMMWNIFPIPYSWFFGKDSDVTFFFNYYIPPGVKGKRVTIFHDMAYKVFPETVRSRTKMMLEANMVKACKRADAILTVSEFTKQEVIKYLNVDPKKITVMPLGIRRERFHCGYSEEQVAAAKEKYHLPSDYLLYLGTLEPRKNIVRLIEAYGSLKQKRSDIPPLILVGRKGWLYDSIFEKIQALHLEDCVWSTGYADSQDVPLLLKGAMAFVFPSVYEGFGMPPLEAMACGTPVLTSNVSSMPEVAGDCAVLVDPFSVESIEEGLQKLIDDPEFRQELSRKGIQRAETFTWTRTANIVLDVFQRLIQSEE